MNDIDKLIEEMEANKPASSCFWGHKWTVWSKPFKVDVYDYYGRATYDTRQKRLCLKCGKVMVRDV